MNILSTVLTIIETAAGMAQGLTPSGESQNIEKDIESLTKIIQSAAQAHYQATGKPIDLTQLTDLPLVK